MNIKLLKNRSDIGAGTRGSDLGIDALEIAAINQNNDFFHRHLFQDIVTHNETIYQKNTNSFAKRIEHVAEQCNRVCDAVSTALLAVLAKDRAVSILAAGATGLFASVMFIIMAAPDVAMTEASIGSGLTTFIFFFALRKVREREDG